MILTEAAWNLRERFAAGEAVTDETFDAHLPEWMRRAAPQLCTPVDVTSRVVRWLTRAGAQRVLDIGSGAGKFCVVAAMTSDLMLVGLERRHHLVTSATDLARQFGLGNRVLFLGGETDAHLVPAFDAIFLFNPFEKDRYELADRLEGTPQQWPPHDHRRIAQTEEMLANVAPGTQVVTYDGFGGRLCGTFDLADEGWVHGKALRLWVKSIRQRDGRWWSDFKRGELLAEAR